MNSSWVDCFTYIVLALFFFILFFFYIYIVLFCFLLQKKDLPIPCGILIEVSVKNSCQKIIEEVMHAGRFLSARAGLRINK